MTAGRTHVAVPLGLTTRSAVVILTLVVAFLTAAVLTDPATEPHRALHLAAAAVMVVAMGSVLGRSHRNATFTSSTLIVVALVAPAAGVFATWTEIPGVGGYLWSWPLYVAGLTESVLCLKGRLVPAILSHVGVATALAIQAWKVDGTPATAFPSLGSYVPLFLVSLLIALYVRPVVQEVAALRDAGERAARAEAAAVAAVAARNDRLDWIERTAGPWLRRIASGAPLDAADREECRLLEAGIRDALRAPGLTGTELDGAVSEARRRGVEVVLLDDGALDRAPPEAAGRLRREIAGMLTRTGSGRVTVRISPRGRDEVATILTSTDRGQSRRVLTTADLHSSG